ncbi:MAG TPA: UDP-N-acetylglucosamine 2-epimerase (non-hydrolyzing) [candidate division Zixibacteria bacterium]|nr:UDP-N-acetylglucosamine 2-epimerase (non-hydrolyzing) [candidate division Zixibacteria bacterium]
MLVFAVIGTRPEAIKIAPVLGHLNKGRGSTEVHVCITGQHREMLDQMLGLFDITPDTDLDIMQPRQNLSQTAALVLDRIDPVLARVRPDWVVVQGDTTTVMASAIAAHHRKIRVAHIEAGLRSYDRENPFPEEMNRVIADHVSDVHFAPTSRAKENLLKEGINPSSIFVTGNTVIDALQGVKESPLGNDQIDRWVPADKNLILVTAHRRENHGRPLQGICDALSEIARRDDVHIVYTVHRNPEVWYPVHERLDGENNITLLPPVDYPTMVKLMVRSKLILTDSGGIQEEAPSLGKPVLVLRTVTERPEAVEAGANRVVGTDAMNIVMEVYGLLDDEQSYLEMAKARNPYGDGRAAERIALILEAGGTLPSGLVEWA